MRAREIPPGQEPEPIRAPLGAAKDRDETRRRLIRFAWQHAGKRYGELGAEGIDPTAPNCWSGLPVASSDAMLELKARINELLDGAAPSYELAEEVLRRRIDVAAAEGRRDRRRDYMTPARMWAAKSFAIASAMSPQQAARPRQAARTAPRAEPAIERPAMKTFT